MFLSFIAQMSSHKRRHPLFHYWTVDLVRRELFPQPSEPSTSNMSEASGLSYFPEDPNNSSRPTTTPGS
jgi:hypothetical protein